MTDLAGKVAVVTGGTSGIGRAAAAILVRRGASVVIVGRDARRGEAAMAAVQGSAPNEGLAELFTGDVSRESDVRALVEFAVERFGRLDYAFNNAASMGAENFRTTADLTLDEFELALARNLTSVWLCMKHEIHQMLRQGGGAIVNTSSVNGLGGVRGAGPYAVCKAGVLALTKSAAQEYATNGIRVNAIVAGAFDTPMLRGVMERHAAGDAAALAAVEQAYIGMIPMGRIGRPEEAAEAAVWLCTDAASYVTGHSLIVDGGWTSFTR